MAERYEPVRIIIVNNESFIIYRDNKGLDCCLGFRGLIGDEWDTFYGHTHPGVPIIKL